MLLLTVVFVTSSILNGVVCEKSQRCLKGNGDTDQTTRNVTEEARLIALESSGELLSPVDLEERITEDLELIRLTEPKAKEVIHKGKWIPGELVARSYISVQKRNELDRSQYGPIKFKPMVRDAQAEVILFSKPYHPEELVKILQSEFNIRRLEPNVVQQDGSRILYNVITQVYTFINKKADTFEVHMSKEATDQN